MISNENNQTMSQQQPKSLTILVNQIKLSYRPSMQLSTVIGCCCSVLSSAPILNNLSLQIPQGSIYGLLGPSGCGKTSLIRCILGILPVESGEITVLGKRPGSSGSSVPGPDVGYMPQDITLYNDLTISETLWYFASLTGLIGEQIKDRTRFLISLLNLESVDKDNLYVGQLSGGQRRRVSLATAMIHNPPLLILDEPTVGVDPLLRRSIWQHLVSLSQSPDSPLTVLITTHYIEEANSANYVGLMRDGRILAEDRPDMLLTQYQLPTLEQVFLHLCNKDEQIKAEKEEKVEKQNIKKVCNDCIDQLRIINSSSPSSSSLLSIKKSSALLQIGSIIRKNLYSLYRSPGYLFFQFFLPMLEAILFCLCLGLDLHDIPVAIYNGDIGGALSNTFLIELNKKIIEKYFFNDNVHQAIEAVEEGKMSTAILIPENFTQCYFYHLMFEKKNMMVKKLTNKINYFDDNDDRNNNNCFPNSSSIQLAVDMSNQLMVQFVVKETTRAFTVTSKQLLGNLSDPPIQIMEPPIYGSNDQPFTSFMASGTMLSISFLSALSLTTMGLVVERTHGLIERTVIVGVGHLQIIIAHLFTNLALMLVQVVLMMVVVFVIFDVQFNGPLVWIGLLIIGQSICGMCYGLFVASIAPTENIATMLALGAFFPNFLLSGAVWPVEAMATILRYIAYVMPATMPTQSLRFMIIRGWSIDHWQVYLGFVAVLAWIVLFLSMSTMVIRFNKYKKI